MITQNRFFSDIKILSQQENTESLAAQASEASQTAQENNGAAKSKRGLHQQLESEMNECNEDRQKAKADLEQATKVRGSEKEQFDKVYGEQVVL